MSNYSTAYNIPKGYSGLRTAVRSYRFLKDPINFICNNMQLYGGSYSAKLPQYPNFILTQDAAFINYVLRDNHTNYHKSPLSSGRAAQYLGKGMLFINGDEWLKQRRLAQPGFHREKIQGLYHTVVKAIDEYLATMPVGLVDMYPLLYRLAFNVIIKSLFDINLSPETMQLLSGNFSEIQDFVMKDVNQPFRRPFYAITGAERKTMKKSEEIRTIFSGIIQSRKAALAAGESFNDLLDMLMQATYEDTGLPMPEEQLIYELLVLMFAGHETTANVLSWMLYLLSVNPAVLKNLTNCVQQTDVLSCPRNEYLNAAINETMRLYPAAWITDREALTDDGFGEYRYPKGTIIIPFFYGTHRDKAVWPDADTYNPSRFLDENGKAQKFKNYFPFGAGPRLCIGNNFAMAEMAFFLHAFLNHFTIQPTGQVPKMKPLLTLRPDKVMLQVARKG